MDINQTGNSKERREQLKREIDVLGKNLPFKFEKNSQLRILKAICTYIKKDKHLGHINQLNCDTEPSFCSTNDTNMDQISSGFITCFTNKGDLVYISDNISDYFGINALDVLFAYDNISEIPCKHDSAIFAKLFRNYQSYVLPNKISFYSSWFVSRIQKKNIYLNEYKKVLLNSELFKSPKKSPTI
ncbi:Neuronal PAS domain-containing 4 [Brachionus plicatilis]|uniref:Neuronal PAS domain-containing 4 n=1 Tax=Brachionus plicatilis TaxID=10195 RepID=A0A3M7RHW4_BRAPC|nr:Neuronal PAS domain-containing 4 [Brachionus plicatilis]